MKKYLAYFLALIMAISLIPQGLFTIDVQAETPTSGMTGDCTWTLDGTVLTISGNGSMGTIQISSPIHNPGDFAPPWGTKITKAIIESGVTDIPSQTFLRCFDLTSVTIPDSVTFIATGSLGAFNGTSSLISFTVDTDNAYYCAEDGVLFNKDKTTLIAYPTGRVGTYTIPNSVTAIGNYAFYSCDNLTSVSIPDSVLSIGEHAFYLCENLTTVTIPNTITSISDWTFSYCYGLTSITIPDTIISISDSAFASCYHLNSVGYAGSEEDRANMTINSGNYYLLNATWYYNYCGDDAHSYTNGCDMDCNTCQWPRIGEHTYDNSLDKDCNLCGHARTFEEFPISGISAEPITVVEGTDGYWSYTYDNGNRTNEYFRYSVSPLYTITMNDGLVLTSPEYDIYQFFGQFPRINDTQSYENQWSVGTHTVSISIGNITGQFTFTITESPIASISVAPITLYEGANGAITHYYSTNTDYYRYNYTNQLCLVVFNKNGSVETISWNDGYNRISTNDNQSPTSPWGLGKQKATAYYNHLSCEVDITIEPNPVEGIELIKSPKTAYITGEMFDLSGAVLRVHFNDNTSEDISIPHYFTYPNHTQYFCNKVKASDMITVSSGLARDAAPGAFTTAGEQVLTLTYFGQSTTLPVTVTKKPIKSIVINDDNKNLDITVTYTDNTIQEMTAQSFISGAGDATPDVSNRYGELRTDKGIYYATFSTYNDGSMSLSMNGVTSNILENGCDWYDIYMEKQYGRYGYSVLGDMSSHLHPYNNKITASNINSVIDYSLLGEDLEYIETNDIYTTPEGYSNYGNWYNGQDVRNIILKKFAVDTIDLSLSIHYDSKNDRYPVLGTGAAAGPEYPATLTYKDNYWEMCWPILTPEASYAYSYAHFDDEGRILRFSAGAPITEPAVQIGDADYDSFEEALSAAVAGQTITLNADVVATEVCTMLGADVTLDLNGHRLTVSNFITFGDVVDTTEGEGKLIISDDPTKAFTNLQENNSQMPLYDEDGYRFFRYSVLNCGTRTAADGKSMQFGTHVQLANRKAYELLTKEKNGNTAITFHITYQGQTFDYTFKAETLALYGQTVCDKYDNNVADKTGTVLVLTVIGFDPADGDPDIHMEVDYHSTRTLVHKKQSIH